MTVRESLKPQRGPCALCGDVGYPLSMGGTDICPACDSQPPQRRVKQLADEVRRLRQLLVQLPGGREILIKDAEERGKQWLAAFGNNTPDNNVNE